jgi:protein TonB
MRTCPAQVIELGYLCCPLSSDVSVTTFGYGFEVRRNQHLPRENKEGNCGCVQSMSEDASLMQLKKSLGTGLFGLLMASVLPSLGQTEGPDVQTNAREAWKKKIVIQLTNNKVVFPPAARGQSGAAKVAFVIDRQGKLIFRKVLESTGSELLDAAALRTVERSEPFPEPPADVTDDELAFTVPIIFPAPHARELAPKESVEEQRKVDTKIHGVCRGC